MWKEIKLDGKGWARGRNGYFVPRKVEVFKDMRGQINLLVFQGKSEKPNPFPCGFPGRRRLCWGNNFLSWEPTERPRTLRGGAMSTTVEIPKIKKAVKEDFFAYGCQRRIVTKVYFKDGTALTFGGSLFRKEIIFNAYYQKGRDAGMTVEEAAIFAGKGRVEPLKENQ